MRLQLLFLSLLLATVAFLPLAANGDDLPSRSPFGIGVVAARAPGGSPLLRVDFTVPQACVINVDRLHFRTPDGVEIQPVTIPQPELEVNQVSGKTNKVYSHDFSAVLNPADLPGHQLAVKFQGCTNGECYFPEQRLFAADAAGTFTEVPATMASASLAVASASGPIDWAQEFQGFTVKGQQTGYLGASEFTAFLNRALAGQAAADPLQRFQRMGLFATLFLIVAGGFLLNFTPCILPMIPINLAIIGAGHGAKSRMDGFRNGSVYGLGMALAYGTLGLVVVLTGSKFGTLNSSMWFNLGIALIFGVMALGMFDVINIDFSRFSGTGPVGSADKGALAHNAVVLSMGVMSALLAGACVAPVVISVVLLATNFYAKGALAGLALPFLLGLGMALPWPFAGAGLAFMPKPGKWMKYVKYGFGILICGFAIYYGHLAWHARQSAHGNITTAGVPAGSAAGSSAESDQDLLAALRQSRATGQPLFIDIHASWCKDCSAMDETVFNRTEVKDDLKKFIAVRYAAELPNAVPAKPLLDHFNIVGLPAYLVLSSN